MKKRYIVLMVVLIAAGSFLAGAWITFQGSRSKPVERKILHYVDPMNPALKSDKPGIAPCGMPLEPVYADQGSDAAEVAELRASLPPGSIRIAPEKQQLIGVKTATVEKAPWNHTLRVLGRVVPDENLVFRINTATDSWVEKVFPVTTGSLVKENELLATLSFFSLEYRTLVQNYFNLVTLGDVADDNLSPLVNNPQYSEPQLRQMRKTARFAGPIADSSQIDYYRKSLYEYGISPYQLKEMERNRTFPEVIEIRAPAAGFVLFRDISPGLRLARGTELFRIADLSRVWILADIFENEAAYFQPGMRVKMELPYRQKILHAQVSPVLPQFDPATRTLKVRLVAENPGYIMRPDMFVNVEFPLSGPPAIIVPADAVLDSGLKKTVFVDRGQGFFEPRQVETGRTLGERVEITQGLMPGEKIVVSGNFLIDSEARMQQAASGILGKIGRDPVCGMNIDEDRAKADGNMLEYKGKTYFFCDPQCREEFRKEPERYLKKSAPAQEAMLPAGSRDADSKHTSSAPADVSRPRDAKSGPATHDGKTMPVGKTPSAMPETAVPSPGSKPKQGVAERPSAGAPGMGPQSSAFAGAGDGPMSMPQSAAPRSGPQLGVAMPGQKAGEIFPPGTGAPGINQSPQPFPAKGSVSMPLPGTPGSPPMPGSKPGTNQQGTPALPGPGGMPTSMPQSASPMPGPTVGATTPAPPVGGTAPAATVPGMGPGSQKLPGPGRMPGSTPREAAPPSGPQTGEIVAPAPGAPTPMINLRTQRYGLPGSAPQGGSQQAPPIRRPRRVTPPAQTTPSAPVPEGMPTPMSQPPAGSMPLPRSEGASAIDSPGVNPQAPPFPAPPPGGGPMPGQLSPATGTPEVKR